MNTTTGTFDTEKALNAVLYIVERANGGRADMHKIFKTLYFADQRHLSRYGRSITGDTYIAMPYGPVPSMLNDIFKAVRGDSYFASEAGPLKQYIHFVNRYIVEGRMKCDTDYLSESDTQCLDYANDFCRDKSFDELTHLSHGIAYNNTAPNREISVKDILRENGDSEEYAEHIAEENKFFKQLVR